MGPRCFLSNGQAIRKPKQLADLQIKYYYNKMETLVRKLRLEITGNLRDPIDRLDRAIRKWDGRGQVPEFNFRKVSTLETLNFVKRLGRSRSFCHDGLDANYLKLVLPSILQPLTHVINTSLSEFFFANRWKISRTFPLLKDKSLNRMIPDSYGPVSQLPTISKIVERAAQTQLLLFFENTGQLNAAGHAYRTNLSTATTIATIADNLYQATEEKKIS